MAKEAYVCKTCGAMAEEPGHLCNPEGTGMKCTYCGMEHSAHEKHYCKGKLEDLQFVCEKCGRLATSENFLCEPKKVPNA
jgi:DNA-directed RNA polymerase subunit RPC12/RpoP